MPFFTRRLTTLLAATALAGSGLHAAEIKPDQPVPKIPAFPGAEGFGAVSVGGRGGRVIMVTTLHASGPGSLQAACAAKGPRIVVFAVSGVIPIKGKALAISDSNITIAGQTAPGAGITVVGPLSTKAFYNRRRKDPSAPPKKGRFLTCPAFVARCSVRPTYCLTTSCDR